MWHKIRFFIPQKVLFFSKDKYISMLSSFTLGCIAPFSRGGNMGVSGNLFLVLPNSFVK